MSGAKGETVAVFGAGGFVGRALAEHLQNDGHAVIPLRRPDCDLLRDDDVRRTVAEFPAGTRVVVCATVNKNVDNSFSAFQQNTRIAANLAAALASSSAAGVVFLSTVDVYGKQPPHPLSEDAPLRPADFYATAKASSEFLLAASLGPALTVLRLPGIYGRGDGGGSVVGRFIRQIGAGEPVYIRGDGKVQRDYVEIEDVCRTIAHFVRRPNAGSFNLAKGHSQSIAAIVGQIGAALGKAPNIIAQEPDLNAAGDLVFDVKRLREAGVVPAGFIDLDQGVARYLEGVATEQNGAPPAGVKAPLTMTGR